MQVTFPDGTIVQATGLGRPEADPSPHFGLYADDAWAPEWPHEMIDWPDYGLPDDEDAAFASIRAAWQRARSGELVEIGCAAGVGRTGTVLACMATLSGIPGDEAVAWVRANFRGAAVETSDQVTMVLRFAAAQA